jgi:chromate transporter
MSYRELFIGFLRPGIFGYGGGPSVIPLIKYEAVDKYKWMDEAEFSEVFALANALPGPIATKMATYVGYRVKGTMGAFVAVIAHTFPTVIGLIFLLGSLYALKDSPVIKGMIAAVGPVVGVMLGVMAYQFFRKAWKGLGKKVSIVMILISMVALQALGIHPAIVIALFILAAVTKTFLKNNRIPLKHSDSVPVMKRSVEK